MSRLPVVSALLVLLALPASASITVRDSATAGRVDVSVDREPLRKAVHQLGPWLHRGVAIEYGGDAVVSWSGRAVRAEDALRALAGKAGAVVEEDNGLIAIRSNAGPRVTLDVKDEEARDILAAMKQQCGIRNMLVDPKVQGKGTFLFRDLPCKAAFETVFGSLDLDASVEENSVVIVRPRH